MQRMVAMAQIVIKHVLNGFRHRVDSLNAHARLLGPETGSSAPELRGRAVDHGAGSARFYDHYALT